MAVTAKGEGAEEAFPNSLFKGRPYVQSPYAMDVSSRLNIDLISIQDKPLPFPQRDSDFFRQDRGWYQMFTAEIDSAAMEELLSTSEVLTQLEGVCSRLRSKV